MHTETCRWISLRAIYLMINIANRLFLESHWPFLSVLEPSEGAQDAKPAEKARFPVVSSTRTSLN